EDMDGTVELTVFPAPFKAAAALLRSREPILVRGRVDDTEKGRVVLAEEIRPLEQAVAGAPPGAGGPPQACRIRVGGDAELRADGGPHARGDEIARLEERLARLRQRTYASLTAWQRTQLARHPKRPRTLDYIRLLIEEFVELHGDRVFGDDKAVVGGLGRFDGQSVVVIGHQKGRDTRENLARNFGMPHPEGYRKALRLMQLAEKFAKPILTFID